MPSNESFSFQIVPVFDNILIRYYLPDYTVSQKCTNFETVFLEIVMIDFDDIGRNIQKTPE